ncbi:MAG TPA: type II secretion system F family protein, partial [Ornithinibacter sp.]|nr:type II secretion system F family protein [Ornithinibacter sp.]
EWVADFAEVVSVGLDAGLDLASAAVTSARSPGVASRAPWLAERLDGVVHRGLAVGVSLEPHEALTQVQRGDLAVLTTAWRLAEEVGAAASAVTTSAARSIRDRQAARQRLTAVVAGPRTSMWLLTALPLVGPMAGALVGIGPDRLYGSPASRGVALLGLLLTGLGWWWCRVLLRRALRPARTDGDPE